MEAFSLTISLDAIAPVRVKNECASCQSCHNGDIEELLDEGYVFMVKLMWLADLLNVEYKGERDEYAYLAGQLCGTVAINWGGEGKQERVGRKAWKPMGQFETCCFDL